MKIRKGARFGIPVVAISKYRVYFNSVLSRYLLKHGFKFTEIYIEESSDGVRLMFKLLKTPTIDSYYIQIVKKHYTVYSQIHAKTLTKCLKITEKVRVNAEVKGDEVYVFLKGVKIDDLCF